MNRAMKHRMNFQDWSLLLACSFLWGGSFFFVEVALRGLPPFTLVFFAGWAGRYRAAFRGKNSESSIAKIKNHYTGFYFCRPDQ